MYQILKYDTPTKAGRIYTANSFIRPLPEYCFIEKPEGEKYHTRNLHSILFQAKLIEKSYGLFITELEFIESHQNLRFMDFYENKFWGICTKSSGLVAPNGYVSNVEFMSIYLVHNPKDTHFNYDLTYHTNKPNLLLEFFSHNQERYGETYINRTITSTQGTYPHT